LGSAKLEERRAVVFSKRLHKASDDLRQADIEVVVIRLQILNHSIASLDFVASLAVGSGLG
jgi:hypothetical protein